MSNILVMPGTAPVLAQLLQPTPTTMSVLPQGKSMLDAHLGIDWAQWAKISSSMFDSDFSVANTLGGTLDVYM